MPAQAGHFSSRFLDIVPIDGGTVLMGSDAALAIPGDGETPRRHTTVAPFAISTTTVPNAAFGQFVAATGYRTVAERLGWSYVFVLQAGQGQPVGPSAPDAPAWWIPTPGASWRHPEGPQSSIESRFNHPATHISWLDAEAFATWSGMRLPTEAEWECAARGGDDSRVFPWGNELEPDGKHQCNVFQGEFPTSDTGDDGFVGTAPVDAFEPNEFGLHNVIGNVWEWCSDTFDPTLGDDPAAPRILKGGSFLCHESYCTRYRLGARTRQHPASSASNVGFRVASDS